MEERGGDGVGVERERVGWKGGREGRKKKVGWEGGDKLAGRVQGTERRNA